MVKALNNRNESYPVEKYYEDLELILRDKEALMYNLRINAMART